MVVKVPRKLRCAEGLPDTHCSNVRGHSAGLGVGHQAAGPEQAAQFGCLWHHVRGGHQLVKVHHALGDLLDEVLCAHKVCAGLLGSSDVLGLAQDRNTELLACREVDTLSSRQDTAEPCMGLDCDLSVPAGRIIRSMTCESKSGMQDGRRLMLQGVNRELHLCPWGG